MAPSGLKATESTLLSLVECPPLGYGFGQGRPRYVGGGHPRGIGVGVRVHDQGRAETADLAGSGHLAREPPPELRVVRVVGVHDLDRDLAATWRRAQEHPAHATLAKAAQQPERTNLARVAGPQPIHLPHPQETRRILKDSTSRGRD
jgi:hypothetical protein